MLGESKAKARSVRRRGLRGLGRGERALDLHRPVAAASLLISVSVTFNSDVTDLSINYFLISLMLDSTDFWIEQPFYQNVRQISNKYQYI